MNVKGKRMLNSNDSIQVDTLVQHALFEKRNEVPQHFQLPSIFSKLTILTVNVQLRGVRASIACVDFNDTL